MEVYYHTSCQGDLLGWLANISEHAAVAFGGVASLPHKSASLQALMVCFTIATITQANSTILHGTQKRMRCRARWLAQVRLHPSIRRYNGGVLLVAGSQHAREPC